MWPAVVARGDGLERMGVDMRPVRALPSGALRIGLLGTRVLDPIVPLGRLLVLVENLLPGVTCDGEGRPFLSGVVLCGVVLCDCLKIGAVIVDIDSTPPPTVDLPTSGAAVSSTDGEIVVSGRGGRGLECVLALMDCGLPGETASKVTIFDDFDATGCSTTTPSLGFPTSLLVLP